MYHRGTSVQPRSDQNAAVLRKVRPAFLFALLFVFFLRMRVVLKLRPLGMHPPRLCRLAIFLIHTSVPPPLVQAVAMSTSAVMPSMFKPFDFVVQTPIFSVSASSFARHIAQAHHKRRIIRDSPCLARVAGGMLCQGTHRAQGVRSLAEAQRRFRGQGAR